MCFDSGGSAQRMAEQQRADEVARQNRIRQGMASIDTAFAPFNDNFFAGRRDAYVDYATPQIERQESDARRKLILALAGTGNLDSSAAIRKNAELGRDANEARVTATNEGINVANRTRGDVENARSNLVSMLNATGDSSAASSAAMREVGRLGEAEGFSPLGQVFASFLAGVSQIASNASNGYRGILGGSGGAKVGGYGGKGSMRVVGG